MKRPPDLTGSRQIREQRSRKQKLGPSQAWMASLMMPSWNLVVGFLTDWEGLRRLAA